MNFKAKLRLILSRFKMPKKYYLQLEKMLENKDSGIYVFSEDGVLIATNKRKSAEEPIRATVRADRLLDKYPRGIAVSVDGAKMLTDESLSDAFTNVVKAIEAFNKEIYASRYEKARRNGVSRRQDKNNGGAD